MIASVNNISSSSVALLFGTSGASSTDHASTATKLLSDATGNTDDVFKAGNAIGNIIEIVSRMKQGDLATSHKTEVEEINLAGDQGRKLSEFDGDSQWYGVTGTFTTTYQANGERTETFVGKAMGMTDEAYRQLAIDTLRKDQSTLRNQTWLAAYENGTLQETDISDLGYATGMTLTTTHYTDGSARMHTSFDNSGNKLFLEQHTEVKDGVLYDKETGKYAAIGQNGSKFMYFTW